jgi:hypothetical protein
MFISNEVYYFNFERERNSICHVRLPEILLVERQKHTGLLLEQEEN